MITFVAAKPLLLGVILLIGMPTWLSTESLQVIYQRATLSQEEGDKLHLNCTVTYNQAKCTDLETSWVKVHSPDNGTQLTDLNRYLVIMSERGDSSNRSRQVTLEFKNMSLSDNGTFQCMAKCCGTVETAMGHFIQLHVKVAEPKPSNYSQGIHITDFLSVIVHYLFLMLFLPCVQ
ncbi:hypothetical protein MATL_G00176290 [Megalops atlanticus]|uniref:Ig-like domain-containing protein n=1 Tax=Megalops atlanticus TaxID=7932 RepID=A0A9D3SZL0_MEGAT|nr:hypothetical protein MATL_G00176290 [Megalops atlanticus]